MYPSLSRHVLCCLVVAASLALNACGSGTTRPSRDAASVAMADASFLARGALVEPEVAPKVDAGNDPLMIYTLPIGAGNCQVMRCPSQNKIVVFDCGSTGQTGWSRQQVGQFLGTIANAQTEFTISVSHADADHSNYIPDVFANVPVAAIVIGDVINSYAAPFQNWAAAKVQAGARFQQWNGFYRSVAPEPALSCFAPDGNGGWNLDVASGIMAVNAGNTKNDKSLVVGSVYGNFQAVFTGDMTGATEGAITNGAPITLGNTRVITGAHHGADTHGSNSQNWATATSPALLMFSAGTRHYHPRCTATQVYAASLLQNQTARPFQCGQNGNYVPSNPTVGVLLTQTDGLLTVTARNDGNFQYAWGGAAFVTDDVPWPGMAGDSR